MLSLLKFYTKLIPYSPDSKGIVLVKVEVDFCPIILPVIFYIILINLIIIIAFILLYYIKKPFHNMLYKIDYKFISKEINKKIPSNENDLDDILKSIKNAL